MVVVVVVSGPVQEERLRDAFRPFGVITDLTVARERDTQRSRGFGFVEYQDKRDAEAAMDRVGKRPTTPRAADTDEEQPVEASKEAAANDQWAIAVDEAGNKYYYNQGTNETRWDPPPGWQAAGSWSVGPREAAQLSGDGAEMAC